MALFPARARDSRITALKRRDPRSKGVNRRVALGIHFGRQIDLTNPQNPRPAKLRNDPRVECDVFASEKPRIPTHAFKASGWLDNGHTFVTCAFRAINTWLILRRNNDGSLCARIGYACRNNLLLLASPTQQHDHQKQKPFHLSRL